MKPRLLGLGGCMGWLFNLEDFLGDEMNLKMGLYTLYYYNSY